MLQNTQNPPRVTACVPAYNSAMFIRATLESLNKQDYPNLDILISDDASSDDTARICTTFTNVSPRFHLVRQHRRLGWVDNVNELLTMAKGNYIFILPHDDIVSPTYVSNLVLALESRPEAILAYSDTKISFWHDNSHCNHHETLTASYKGLDRVEDTIVRARNAANYHLDICNQHWPDVLTIAFRGIFRRDAVRKTGGLHRNIGGEFGADYVLLFHLALLGEWVRVPETLVEKRSLPDSLSNSWNFSYFERFGEWLGCVTTVHKANLSWGNEIKVYSCLAGAAAKTLFRVFTIHLHWMRCWLTRLSGGK